MRPLGRKYITRPCKYHFLPIIPTTLGRKYWVINVFKMVGNLLNIVRNVLKTVGNDLNTKRNALKMVKNAEFLHGRDGGK